MSVSGCGSASPARAAEAAASAPAAAPAVELSRAVRLSGTVEAVRASTVIVPRLAGQNVNTLTITKLAKAGTPVKIGDVLVEFDPQEQQRIATDRLAEVVDLDGQIQKKRSDQAIARSRDDTEMAAAEHDVERARLGTLNNRFLPRIDAETATLAHEQAQARFAQLKKTYELKRAAEVADLKILEIRRERSDRAREYAEGNSRLMTVHATFAGIAVIKSTFKGSSMVDIQEGDQVRPGLPILDIVDPTAMQVRARVNQADIGFVAPGQAATIRLDAYPELSFEGKVELLAPLAVTSSISAKVRTFTALVSIRGNSPQLMPDLTASVDLGKSGGR
jgi:HlyD family secretion protein